MLYKGRLKAFKKLKKPIISKKNHKKHLQWAINHKNQTIKDQKSIIQSEEIRVNRFRSDGDLYRWHNPKNKHTK